LNIAALKVSTVKVEEKTREGEQVIGAFRVRPSACLADTDCDMMDANLSFSMYFHGHCKGGAID